MPVRFSSLLQDSWNFIQNQRAFSLTAIGLLMMSQLFVFFIFSNAESTTTDVVPQSSMLYSALLIGIANVYITLLLIFNIKAINAGSFQSFFQHAGATFNKLFPALGIYMLMSFPLSMGVSSLLISTEMSLIALPLLIGGTFIFLKLCMATYTLIIEDYRFGEAVKFTWFFTKGKMRFILAYSLIANLLPALIGTIVSSLGNNIVITLISITISAFLSLFTTIFGFRFYQTLRQMA